MSSAIDPDDARREQERQTASSGAPPGPEPATQPLPAVGPTPVEATSTGATVADPSTEESRTVGQRQREQFGGMKIGCAFFGWLAATGMAVLLAALVTAAGAALGLSRAIDVNQATANPNTVGLVGGIVLLVIVFVAYYCGGYVAGRMARFHGARQGLGVWLWAVIIALVITILGLIAGTQFDILARLNGFPRIPINEGTLSLGGVLTAIGVAVVSLVGAVLGGLAGMRFHRRVDRVTAEA
jgi:hypothetical protein